MSPDERLQLLANAHAAVRGKPQTIDQLRKRATGRQAKPPAMSVHESTFAAWMCERDIAYVREMAIDKYNVDFGISPIAVEILGGEWHGTRKKAAGHSRRTPEILDANWSLLFIWATPTYPLTPVVADYAVSYLESVRRDPSLLGEYRVIGGEAQLLARGRAEDYESTGIPAPRKRRNSLG
jgi:very-short-patch-repair endonuclease